MKKLRYLAEYIIFLGLCKFLRLFSIDKAASYIAALMRVIGPCLPVSNIARKNLKTIYGDKIDIEKTITEIWDNFGRFIGEFPFIDTIDQDQRIEVLGIENIRALQGSGRPFLFFSAHQANWEFAICQLQRLCPKIAIIYRKANNPYIEKAVLSQRSKNDAVMMIAKGIAGAKDLVRSIKNGYSIAMLVDQKMNNGIEVPFFNLPSMTSQATAKFSLQYDYPIVPLQVIRKGRSSKFTIILHQPIDHNGSGIENNDEAVYDITCKINMILESWIREHPSQWLWFHNRWKNLL